MTAFSERRRLGFTRRQLFDLVADVERYPEFLPWIRTARILRREGKTLWVEMLVGPKFLRRRVRSKGVLHPPHRIDITSRDAPFKRLAQHWRFETARGGGAIVEFRAAFEFRSRLWEALLGPFYIEGSRRMVAAFERRAQETCTRDRLPKR
jgi:coenzyme Q-binding protein COQ10